MEIRDWVAIISVLVAFLALSVQQWRVWREERKRDKRTANKLKILYLCQTKALTEREIIDRYQEQNPTSPIDESEIRKTIYEMLVDDTLLWIPDNKNYEVKAHDSRFARKPDSSSLQLDEAEKLRMKQMQQQQQ